MKAKKKLVIELIRSLNEDVDSWAFGEHTAINYKWGIEVWIANYSCLGPLYLSANKSTF